MQISPHGYFEFKEKFNAVSVRVSVESGAVQTLTVSAVSTSAALISWNSVPGATGYRLAWGPTSGDFLCPTP